PRCSCSSSLSGRSNLAHIIGVSVSETNAETPTATLRVIANSRNNRPTIPVMNKSGMNTATSETLNDTTVNPICFAPLSAASNGASPASMKRTMFSIITIASSTTNPVEIVSAINERLSRLNPARYMMPKVPMSDSGNATLVMTVAQSFRGKRNITITTSAMVRSNVNCTSRTDARIVSVRSASTSTCTDGGNVLVSRGNNCFTRSTV